MNGTTAVLDGIRVLDFGRFIAAPWCSAILADLGADVIRVEKPGGGEDRWVQAVADGGEGATFLQCNRNKRAITLDTTAREAADVLSALVRDADVVVANMPERSLRRNGIAYDQLRAIREDVILASATAYGDDGPARDLIGFDGTGQVLSGAVAAQGLPDQPIRGAVPFADYGTALSLAAGVLAALLHRERTGDGQHVQAALLPTCLMMANSLLIEQAVRGVTRPRVVNRGRSVAPCDLYRVVDGWVLLQIAGQPMFERWCRLVGREDLIDEERFADDDLRWEHGDELNDIMQAWCEGRRRDEVVSDLQAAYLPAAPMLEPVEVLDDAQVAAMGYLPSVAYPGVGDVPVTDTPFRLSATPGTIRERPPLLGEHTEQVLAEIGLDAARRDALRAAGVI